MGKYLLTLLTLLMFGAGYVNAADTDGDGLDDAYELSQGYDPAKFTKIIYVDNLNGLESEDGSTLAKAKKYISSGVALAKQDDSVENVVLLEEGIYTGSLNRNLDFEGHNIKLRSIKGAATTIIDSEGADNERFLKLGNGEDSSSWLDGFTIRNSRYSSSSNGSAIGYLVTLSSTSAGAGGQYFLAGQLNGKNCFKHESREYYLYWIPDYGGYWMISYGSMYTFDNGMPEYYVYSSSDTPPLTGWYGYYYYGSPPTLSALYDNHGAVLHLKNSSLTVRNCIFEGSVSGGRGGAAYAENSSPIFENCVFRRNTAQDSGGAFLISGGAADFKRCLFEGNTTPKYGGAVSLSGIGQANFENCLFIHNKAAADAGAVYSNDAGAVIGFRNCTISFNESDGAHAGVSSTGQVDINSSIIRDISAVGTSSTVNYSSMPDGSVFSGTGNIISDPQITLAGYLKSNSPCINAGDASSAPSADIHGQHRPSGSRIDIGCDEFTDSDSNGIPNWFEALAGTDLSASGDNDGDGLKNLEEYVNGLDPLIADADADGLNDGIEVANGYDPARFTKLIYVDGRMDEDNGNGSRPETAKQYISSGVALAKQNDGNEYVVLVAGGEYKGPLNRNLDFEGHNIVLLSIEGPAATVIDCESADKERFLTLGKGETSRSSLEGFTIRNGFYSSSAGAGADAYLVSGGGLTAANGQYNIAGQVNGKDYFKHETADYYLYWTPEWDGRWYINQGNTTDNDGSTEYATQPCTDNAPPLAGWFISMGDPSYSPVPTFSPVYRNNGAALNLRNSSLTVRNCIFENNNAGGQKGGGAVYAENSRPVFEGCIFRNNIAANSGGAFFVTGGMMKFSGCSFKDNSAQTHDAGALDIQDGGTAFFENCTFDTNIAAGNGGAVLANASTATFRASVLSGNQAGQRGGAVSLSGTSTSNFENCLLIHNKSVTDAGAVYSDNAGAVIGIRSSTISFNESTAGNAGISAAGQISSMNSIIRDASAFSSSSTVDYSGMFNGFTGAGTHNITVDPQLTLAGWLKSTSPCIDAGDLPSSPSADIHGQHRAFGPNADMGCDEFTDSDSDGMPDWYEALAGGNIAPSGDLDNDGMLNLAEYENGTLPGTLPPQEIQNVAVNATFDKISLSWTHLDPAGDLASFEVYWNGNPAIYATLPKSTPNIEIPGLQADHEYSIKIVSVDVDGNRSAGLEMSVYTLMQNPTGLAGVTDDQTILLTWNPLLNIANLGHYSVYVSSTPYTSVAGMQPTASGTRTSVRLSGLENGKDYYIAVTSVNKSGCELKDVTSVKFVPSPETVPPVITSVKFGGVQLTNNMVLRSVGKFEVTATDSTGLGKAEFIVNDVVATDNVVSDGLGWFWDATQIPDGVFSFKVRVYDVFNNMAEQSYSLGLQLGAPSYVPVITTPVNGFSTTSATVAVTGTGQAYSQIRIYRNDGAVAVKTPGVGGAFSHTLDLVQGSNRITAAAFNRAGEGPRSAVINVLFDNVAPATVTLSADGRQDGQSIKLDWSAYADSDAVSYDIYRNAAAFTDAATAQKITTVTGKTYIDGGLTKGATYHYAVVGVDQLGNRNNTVVSKSAVVEDLAPPAEIQNLKVTSFSDKIGLSWTHPDATGDLASFDVYWNGGTTVYRTLAKETKNLEITGLVQDQDYTVKIVSVDAGGNRSSGLVSPVYTLMANPAGLAGEPGDGAVNLSWTAVPKIANLQHYAIYSSQSTFTSVEGMQAVRTATAANVRVAGLENAKDYYFAVTAVNKSGGELKDVTAVKITPAPEKNPPTITSVTFNSANVANGMTLTTVGEFKTVATDDSGISRAEFIINGATISDMTPADGLSCLWDATKAADGAITLTIRVYDNLNNMAEQAFALNLQLAVPSYTPAIISPVGSAIFNKAAQTVVCTGQPYSEIKLFLNSAAVASKAPDAQGKASFDITLQSGENTMYAVAVNRAGQGPSSATVTVTLDTSIPLAPLTLAASAQQDGQISLSWKKPDQTTIQGYNIYRSDAAFTEISQAQKLNATPLSVLNYTDLPTQDKTYYYRVSMVNTAGTEGTLSEIASTTSDRTAPKAISIVYTPKGAYDAASGIFGLGEVGVVLTLSEPALAVPFLSIVPDGGTPISATLAKSQTNDSIYEGSFKITSTTKSGQAFAVLSVRDMVNNRGTQIDSGQNIVIDTAGPVVTALAVQPGKSIQNNATTPVTVSMTAELDQPVKTGTPPVFKYSLSKTQTDPVDIPGVVQQGSTNTWSFSFTLPATAGQETENMIISYLGQDDLGNTCSTIVGLSVFQVYQNELPALTSPLGFTGKSLPGGFVQLGWLAVKDASGYVLFRGKTADTLQEVARANNVITYTDLPPEDGIYFYALASLRVENGQESVSAYSNILNLLSDATAPPSPKNLTIALATNGIALEWQAPDSPGEAITYSIYRSNAAITSFEGLQPLAKGITALLVVDTNPVVGYFHYTVATVDAVGNVSLPAGDVYENFQLLPISGISVVQEDSNPAVLSWTHSAGASIAGYNVYTDGRTQPEADATLLNAKTYTDRFYMREKTRDYVVKAVDAEGVMTPARSISLPTVTILPAQTIQLRRGTMNKVNYVVHNGSSFQIANARLQVECSGHTYLSDKFTIESGSDKQAYVVVAGYKTLTDTVNLKAALVVEPEQGAQYKISRNLLVSVTDSVLPIDILNQEFVRGVGGKVQFTMHNTSDVDVDIVTAQGTSPSSRIRFKLLDAEGNVLALGSFFEVVGDGFISLANGDTVRRIPAGGSYTSALQDIFVPSSAPANVTVQLEIDNIYYSRGSLTEAVLDGISTRKTISLTETTYYGNITSINPAVSFGKENIVIKGQSILRATGTPAPNAALRLGVTINGFDRTYDISTDSLGAFTYEFVPQRGEAGIYNVWVVHPDRKDKTFQSQFIIKSVSAGPESVSLRIPYGYQKSFPVQVATVAGTDLHNLEVVYNAANQPSGTLIPGLHVTPSLGTALLTGGQSYSFDVNVWADDAVPQLGTAVLKVVSDEGTWVTVTISFEFFKPVTPPVNPGDTVQPPEVQNSLPRVELSPNVVLTGVARGSSITEYVGVSNKGMAALENVQISLLNTNGTPAPSWVSLSSQSSYPRIEVGESKQIGVTFMPTATTNEGNYSFYLRIASSNYPTLDIGLYPAVTDSGIGNILFKASDMYTNTFDASGRLIEGVGNAKIYIQNTNVLSIDKTVYTDGYGEALIKDLPSGFYAFKVTKDKHNDFGGRLWVKPGITQIQEVYLIDQLVTVQWSVVPTTITDTYEISLNATFETNVPAAVVAITPTSVTLPDMKAGDVFTGQYKMVNYGLIRAQSMEFSMAESPYYKFELLSEVPKTLEAKEEYTVTYRVVCIKTPLEEAANATGGDDGNSPCQTIALEHILKGEYCGACGKIIPTESKVYTFSRFGYCPPAAGGGNYTSTGGLPNVGSITIYVPPVVVTPPPASGGSTTTAQTLVLPDTPPGPVNQGQPLVGEKCPVKLPKNPCLGPDGKMRFGCSVNLLSRQYEDGEAGDEIYDLQVHSGTDSVNVQRYYEDGKWNWWHTAQRLEFYGSFVSDEELKASTNSSGTGTVDSLPPFEYVEPENLAPPRISQNGTVFERDFTGVYRYNTQKIFKTGTGWRSEDKFKNYYNYDFYGRLLEYGTSAYPVAKFVYTGVLLTGVLDRNGTQIIWYEYNEQGQISAVRDRDNHRTEYTYVQVDRPYPVNSYTLGGTADRYLHLLTEIKDNAGGVTKYVYDTYGRITSKTDAAGRKTLITYGPVQEVYDNSGFYRIEFNAQGKAVIRHAVSRKVSQSTDGSDTSSTVQDMSSDIDVQPTGYDLGTVTSIYDENGFGSTFTYDNDAAGKSFYSQTKDSTGQVREVWFDDEGEVVRVDINGSTIQRLNKYGRSRTYVDEKGNSTSFEMDEYKNITKITYPNSTTETFEYEYNFNGVTRYKDQEGNITEYAYDAKGLPTLMKEVVGTPLERHIQYTYDANGNLLTQTVAANIPAEATTSSFEYNADGVKTVTDPVGNSVTYENYNSMGNPGTMRDDMGNVWSYEYDDLMRLVKITSPLNKVSRLSYNNVNNPVAFTAPNEKQAMFEYDNKNNLVKTTDPLGNKTQIIRNSDGLPVKTVDPSGKISILEYDKAKRLIKIIRGENVISYTYNDSNNTLASVPYRVDFPTFYRVFAYDNMQKIKHVEEFDLTGKSLRSLNFSYDVLGRVSSVSDKAGGVRSNTYDVLGRLTKTIGINGDVTEFKFDARDNLIELKSAKGGISHYEYDPANRMTKATTPEGKVTSYCYGKEKVDGQNFRTVTEILPGGEKFVIWINTNGNHVKREIYKCDSSAETVIQYTYDSIGNLLSGSNGTTSIAFTYDDIGRKLSETTNYGTFSKTNSYTYNANGTLASYTGPDSVTYAYTYDATNRLSSIDIPGKGPILFNSYQWNSPLQMTLPGGATVNYTYDALMRTTNIESKDPVGQLIVKRGYEYNSTDNIATKITESGTFGYEYDMSRFLSKVNNPDGTNETFTYDLLGNRMTDNGSAEWTYNLDNQLLATPQATYEYNVNGSLTKKTAGGIIYDYFWNAQGQLIEIKENGATTATYAYDPFGRRISKTVNGTKIYFHYNNWGLCGEYDADGNELRTYGYSPSSMAPLFIKQGGEYYYYLNDHMGAPQKIISGSGRVVWSAVYGAYGKALISVQEVENNFRFPGQYYDDETGLHYNFFRYYDTETGRYISVDPAKDGINFYTYCNANPLGFVDPYGLCRVRAAASDALAIYGAYLQGLGEGAVNEIKGIGNLIYGGTVGLGEQLTLTGMDVYTAYTGGSDFQSAIFQGVTNMTLEGNGSTGQLAGEAILQASGYRFGNDIYSNIQHGYETGDWSGFSQNMGQVGFIAASPKIGPSPAQGSGAYYLEFQSGKIYIGKGLKGRMLESTKRIENKYGDKIKNCTFYPTSSEKAAFIKEYKLMKGTGELPSHWDPSTKLYNKIWSPGKKLSGE
ncbi:MAG TPA: hypothetical protein DET40_04770 [Lentisphaeria bacterium]|nr:MAG: hypothetical protein A2X45_13345 [Lentisphaerae bacterium GWF2_50_93]HCE42838.1 hypothetical protein [Lentisphaeria bacterium]